MARDNKKTIIIVDGSSYLFRAYHALPPLTNQGGEPTGALYGVMNMLRRLLEERPDRLVVVFDTPGPNFRHRLYEDYKANRTEMPEDLAQQIPWLHDMIEAMGIPLIAMPGEEADDVIGSLAKQAEAEGFQVVISTGDKDFAQLVNDQIVLVNTMNNSRLDIAGVEEKFGLLPERMIDYLSLVGDAVDNIPGVPKVGPKTAVKWLTQYGDIEGIKANAHEIKGKVGESLRDNLDSLALSQQLVTIKIDMTLPVAPASCCLRKADQEKLRTYLKRFEFKAWLSDLKNTHLNPELNQGAYHVITDSEGLGQWLKEAASDPIGLYALTEGSHYLHQSLVGIGLSSTKSSVYYPIEKGQEKTRLTQLLKHREEYASQVWLMHDVKSWYHLLSNWDLANLWPMTIDTMLMAYVMPNWHTKNDIEDMGSAMDDNWVSTEQWLGKGVKRQRPSDMKADSATIFAAQRAALTVHWGWSEYQKLSETQKTLLNDLDLPLVKVLYQMEQDGVLLDIDRLKTQSIDLEQALAIIEKEIFEAAGESFNIQSPKQLQAILYDKLHYPVLQKTKTGQPSTAEPVLQELADEYALPKAILKHRSLSKLKQTYTDKLPELVDDNHRVHSSFHQAVTSTGRLSSSEPNLQNIPVRHPEGRLIRQAFIAREGYQIVSADYSQIELRLMAHLSQDEKLLQAFESGQDVHRATASEVFGTPLDSVTSSQRREAKAINFGLMYGMSAFGLAKQLNMSRKDADAYIERYFKQYPGVKQYMLETRQQAHEQGFVETLSHRQLYLPQIRAKNLMLRKAAERAAINAPLQGSASDIIKQAMLLCHDWISQENLSVTLIMQVHDELVFEVKTSDLPQAMASIEQSMLEAAKTVTAVPFVVDCHSGEHWEAAH